MSGRSFQLKNVLILAKKCAEARGFAQPDSDIAPGSPIAHIAWGSLHKALLDLSESRKIRSSSYTQLVDLSEAQSDSAPFAEQKDHAEGNAEKRVFRAVLGLAK